MKIPVVANPRRAAQRHAEFITEHAPYLSPRISRREHRDERKEGHRETDRPGETP